MFISLNEEMSISQVIEMMQYVELSIQEKKF